MISFLRSIFTSRKYDDGYAAGWRDGFDLGTQASRSEAKKVTVKALQKAMRNGNIEYKDGLQEAINIIKESVNA